MGRPLFCTFLDRAPRREAAGRGVTWHGVFRSWDALLADGRARAADVARDGVYVVDPTAGLDAFAAFFAVATTPDTLLLWAEPGTVPGELVGLGPGLSRVVADEHPPLTRPMWGTATSGSAGTPKIPVGYADTLELLALQYDAELYGGLGPGGGPAERLATPLPLEYAAAFMMLVVPAVFLRKDLVVFPPHDWRPFAAAAGREPVACLTVPSIAVAGAVSLGAPCDLSRAALFMASGYLTAERVRTIRSVMGGVRMLNCYGASETGVVSLDRDAGGNPHVGKPIAGKPVWIEDADAAGVGAIATTGLDCREHYWNDDRPLRRPDGVVAVTDAGRFDRDGNLVLEGRLDGGEKLHGITVYPRRVERHLLTLDGVADVKVSVRNDDGLDRLTARVVGRVDEAAVRAHCAVLPEIERPARIECVPESIAAYSARGKL